MQQLYSAVQTQIQNLDRTEYFEGQLKAINLRIEANSQ